MNMFGISLAGAAIVGGVTVYVAMLYGGGEDCAGGHVWDEWEASHYWKAQEFVGLDELLVQRRYKRSCERCDKVETEWRNEGDVVPSQFSGELEVLVPFCEVEYQCPNCHSSSKKSDLQNESRAIRDGRKFGYRCPTCQVYNDKPNWIR